MGEKREIRERENRKRKRGEKEISKERKIKREVG